MVRTAYLSHLQVQATHANRGNVAIIVWNTLEAPYVWDVDQTEYEGTINLGNSKRSLLSIYFRDYVYGEDSNILKEAEYMTVAQVPSTDGELGEKQIVLRAEDEYADAFWDAFSNRPKRGTDEEEATIKRVISGDNDEETEYEIVAYAPNAEELDSLYGKVVTVIFGKDNEVVSIRVVDETVEDEYLTAWEDKKLTIGGNSYKFATSSKIYMNTVEMDDMDDVFETLHIKDATDFNKVIKANVILNNSGKVTRLDLFVSGNYEEVSTKEAVVSKVRNEVITLSNDEEIDYGEDGKYEDEDDQPRIMKDGKIIGIEDIEAGDVLTYYYDDDTIKTIYVSSEKKDGELTRVSKTDLRMTVDGEKYFYSMGDELTKFLFTDDKISDAKLLADATDYVGEEVTLYLNVYGEYVLMASEKASNDWTFGIVTSVRDTEDDEEDDDIYRIPVRILIDDGTTARNYKFIFDDEEDRGSVGSWETTIANLENKLVVFAADANGEIAADDFEEVTMATATIADGDYETVLVRKNDVSVTVDDDRERINGKIFGSETVIFNIAHDLGEDATADTSDDSYDPETTTSWKVLVENKALAQDALLIFEDDSKTLSYVLIDTIDYATSDAEYAIVKTEDYKEKKGSTTKKYVDLLLADASEEETFEAKDLKGDYVVGKENMFVEYKLSGSKLDKATMLIDLPAFKKLRANEAVTDEVVSAAETKLIVNADNKYTSIKLDGIVKPNYSDGTAEDGTAFNSIFPSVNNVDSDYYFYEIAAVPTGNSTIIQENNALAPWDADGVEDELKLVDGTWTKTKDYSGPDTLVIPLTAGTKAKVTVKQNDTITVFEIDATALVIDKDAADVTATDELAKTESYTYLKANFKVVDTQKLLLEYEDDEDDVPYSLGEVVVDEDVIVLDARNKELKETTFSALRDEVKADGYVYVIPFANNDAYNYGRAGVEANILVIVD